MFIVYSDARDPNPPKINVWDMDGTRAYLGHFDNLMYLEFMAEKGTIQEKFQAEKEMKEKCLPKLKWWKNHPNYDEDKARKGIELIKKKWNRT